LSCFRVSVEAASRILRRNDHYHCCHHNYARPNDRCLWRRTTNTDGALGVRSCSLQDSLYTNKIRGQYTKRSCPPRTKRSDEWIKTWSRKNQSTE
jgi:hypothetical protein